MAALKSAAPRVLVALAATLCVVAQCATFTGASVQPAHPTAADPITLVVTRSLTPSYAVRFAPDSVSIAANTVDIVYSGIPTTGFLPPPFVPLQVPLGQLASGAYNVNVYVQPVGSFGAPPASPPILEITSQIAVFNAPANYDPRILPSPTVAGAQLYLWAALPQMGCFNTLRLNGLTTAGNEYTLSYTVSPRTGPGVVCFTITPPLVLYVPIGTLAPGQYTARAIGDFQGVMNPPIVVSFTVLPSPLPAVEYYRVDANHYFMTADANEINTLDTGYFPGWVRTGQTLTVLPPTAPLSGSLSPVCRFYGKPEAGLDSHFYSAAPAECQAVIDQFSSAWIYESGNVFETYLPSATNGSCPENTMPVYRVYNNRQDVNHRYTTSINVRSQMINAGWVPEGYGGNTVAMCAL
jgi:hypothetical protein